MSISYSIRTVLTVSTGKRGRDIPEANQLDNTFGIESSDYKLNAILYHNPTISLGEVDQFSFMADKTADSFTHLLETCKAVGGSIPKIILIDKVQITILLFYNLQIVILFLLGLYGVEGPGEGVPQ